MTAPAVEPVIGCGGCGGPLVYRVRFDGFTAPADNFDQLVDHIPMLFTARGWLEEVARDRKGRVTVWHLADADQGGDWSKDVVVAYAGPHPGDVPGRTFLVDLSGHGFYEELVAEAGPR